MISTTPHSSFRRSVALACCFAALLVACKKSSTRTQGEVSSSAVASSASSAPAPTTARPPIRDADVVAAIQRHFALDNRVRSAPVGVAVVNGVATLTGTVDSLLTKEHALHVAETIRGVRSVVNEIAVAPAKRSDEELRADVLRTLKSDLATHPYSVGVAVKDATVIISGTADSWQQKKLFGEVAKRVRGVRALDNEVVVHYANVRPDTEILTDVKDRIANDVWLDGDVLGVTVANRVVHLEGIVASVAQKTAAREDALVAGVVGVNDDDVFVDAYARDDQRATNDKLERSDAETAAAVRDAFRVDPRLKTLVPQVTVQHGSAVLRGTVDSAAARDAAADDAKNTLGVLTVRNEVVVQPGGQPSDADIQRAVSRALAEDPFVVHAKSIKVSSTNGKVALTGTIDWGSERFDVIADAFEVPGVREVDDRLVIERPAADIQASIVDRLSWDPNVPLDRVQVSVAPDGVATLTGTLDSWSEIKAATNDALWGGASRVINLVKVTKHPQIIAP